MQPLLQPRGGSPARRPPRSGAMGTCPGHWFPSTCPSSFHQLLFAEVCWGCNQQLFLEMAVGHVEKMPAGFLCWCPLLLGISLSCFGACPRHAQGTGQAHS